MKSMLHFHMREKRHLTQHVATCTSAARLPHAALGMRL